MSRVTRSGCALIAMPMLVSSAFADWTAYAWETSGSWEPTPSHEIRINAPGQYKFFATSGGPGDALDEIRGVFLDANITSGEVVVHIIRDPNYGGGRGSATPIARLTPSAAGAGAGIVSAVASRNAMEHAG